MNQLNALSNRVEYYGFTYTLWRSSEKMWNASRAALEHSENTAERQLRAYIAIEIRGVNLTLLADGIYSVIVSYITVNYGHTPAHDVETDIAYRVLPFPLPGDTVIQDPSRDIRPLRGTIAPNQRSEGIGEKPVRIEPFQMRDAGNRLYMIMLVTYRDAFDKVRKTEVCGSLHLLEDMVHAHKLSTKLPAVQFVWAEKYNRAT